MDDSGLEVHKNIICDACRNPVLGYRYKCMECMDFDLCSDCEKQKLHPEHLMLRLSHRSIVGIPRRSQFDISISKPGSKETGDTWTSDSFSYKCLQCQDSELIVEATELSAHDNHLMVRVSRFKIESFDKNYETMFETWFNFHLLEGTCSFWVMVTIKFADQFQHEVGVRTQGVIHGDLLCLICCENVKNTILRPCKHASTCKICTQKLFSNENPKCPICSARFSEYEMFFM